MLLREKSILIFSEYIDVGSTCSEVKIFKLDSICQFYNFPNRGSLFILNSEIKKIY